MTTNGIYIDEATGDWFWEIGERWRSGFASEMEAVRDNNLNSRGSPYKSSRFKGVQKCKRSGKWKVITGTKEKTYLGRFDIEEDAARAYNEYAKTYFGPTAYLNPV